jgi:hypothetical protein
MSASRPAAGQAIHLATDEDLRLCYRLFLGREPDAEGWDFWTGLIRRDGLPLANLVQGFLQSREYRLGRGSTNEPVLIELDEFRIYVQPPNPVVGRDLALRGQARRADDGPAPLIPPSAAG